LLNLKKETWKKIGDADTTIRNTLMPPRGYALEKGGKNQWKRPLNSLGKKLISYLKIREGSRKKDRRGIQASGREFREAQEKKRESSTDQKNLRELLDRVLTIVDRRKRGGPLGGQKKKMQEKDASDSRERKFS